MMRKLGWALMVAIVVATACEEDDDDMKGVAGATIEEEFVMHGVMSNFTEIEFGKLAASKALRQEVKEFGSMMVNDHTPALNEAKALAADKGISTVEGMDFEHTQLFQTLNGLSGHSFDSAYMKGQVEDHELNVLIFETQQRLGTDEEIKAYADKYAPAIRQHRDHAKMVNDMLSAPDPDQAERN